MEGQDKVKKICRIACAGGLVQMSSHCQEEKKGRTQRK